MAETALLPTIGVLLLVDGERVALNADHSVEEILHVCPSSAQSV
jgi:hypothetical protein